MTRLIVFNKPYGVLTQFSGGADGRPTLADFIPVKDVYPAGRLDRDSEGLLLLTDNGRLQARIAEPRQKLEKTYLAQVEGLPGPDALAALANGVDLKDGRTRPARVRRIAPPEIWPRVPPIRARKSVPDCWIELGINEGRNRQVRRMTAAVGHPCLRLVRWQIGPVGLNGLQPGAWAEISATVFADLPRASKSPSHARRAARGPRRKP
ncbi:MAG: pseudouridine synthase [Pseudomonadota bacterium]